MRPCKGRHGQDRRTARRSRSPPTATACSSPARCSRCTPLTPPPPSPLPSTRLGRPDHGPGQQPGRQPGQQQCGGASHGHHHHSSQLRWGGRDWLRQSRQHGQLRVQPRQQQADPPAGRRVPGAVRQRGRHAVRGRQWWVLAQPNPPPPLLCGLPCLCPGLRSMVGAVLPAAHAPSAAPPGTSPCSALLCPPDVQ